MPPTPPAAAPTWMSGAVIVGGSALLWVVARYLNNNVLFEWAEVTEYRHWIFLPAGVKLILALVFGWRGALGVTLGTCTYLQGNLPALAMPQIAMVAVALGFGPLIAVRILRAWTGLASPWFGMEARHLVAVLVLSAALCATAFQGLLVAFGVEDARDAPRQIAIMMFGDVTGAALLLSAAVGLRRLLRAVARSG